MRVIRDRRVRPTETDPLRSIVRVDDSVSYDFLSSLRVLYMPRTYQALRRWSAATKKRMSRELYEEGRFFFEGHETCVGFGVIRLIPDLGGGAMPEALIDAIRRADAVKVGLYMLEGAGDLPPDRLEAFQRLMTTDAKRAKTSSSWRGLSTARRARFQEIVTAPKSVQKRLARFLERYQQVAFADLTAKLKEPLRAAARTAKDTLAVLPTAEAIERLTGGYTLSTDISLRRITLAPSVFFYPHVASRVDERGGEALIVYGVQSSFIESHDPTPVNPALIRALRALSDANRFEILRLLSQRPHYGPEIVESLRLAQPTVHHHIAQLRVAELVRQERTRNGMLCSLRADGMRSVVAALTGVLDAAAAADDGGSMKSRSRAVASRSN